MPGTGEGDTLPVAPTVAEGVAVRWLDPAAPWAVQAGAVPTGTTLAPALAARVALLFDEARLDLRTTEEWEAVCLHTALDRVARAEAAESTRTTSALVTGPGSLLGAVLGGRRSARRMARDMGAVRRASADRYVSLRCGGVAGWEAQPVEQVIDRQMPTRGLCARPIRWASKRSGPQRRGGAAGRRRQRPGPTQARRAHRPRAGLAAELAGIDATWTARAAAVGTVDVAPEKSDIRVSARALVWVPVA